MVGVADRKIRDLLRYAIEHGRAGDRLQRRSHEADRDLVPRDVVVRAIADFRRIAQQMLTHPILDQLTQFGLHGPGHEAGVYQRERLPTMRLHARRRAGSGEQEEPQGKR